MITRTIETTTATFAFINADLEVWTDVATLPSNMDTEEALKYIRKHIDNRAAKIVDISTTTKLYGMEIETFIENAIELDPETRKPIQ